MTRLSPTSRTSTTRRHRSVALLGAAALLFTGCGSATPGSAVELDGERISLAQTNRAAEALCLGAEQELRDQGQSVPMSVVRRAAVNILSVDQVVRGLMDEYDVQPGADYAAERAQYTRDADRLPERLRADYVEVMTVQSLINSVALELGAAALREEGNAEPTEEEAGERVNQLLSESWPAEGDVHVDPRFGLALSEGQLVSSDTSLSVPVSEVALAGAAEQPDPSYASSLPARQRCG